eukprot:UN05846
MNGYLCKPRKELFLCRYLHLKHMKNVPEKIEILIDSYTGDSTKYNIWKYSPYLIEIDGELLDEFLSKPEDAPMNNSYIIDLPHYTKIRCTIYPNYNRKHSSDLSEPGVIFQFIPILDASKKVSQVRFYVNIKFINTVFEWKDVAVSDIIDGIGNRYEIKKDFAFIGMYKK